MALMFSVSLNMLVFDGPYVASFSEYVSFGCPLCCKFLWICQFLMAPMLPVSLNMSVLDVPYVASFSGYVSF